MSTKTAIITASPLKDVVVYASGTNRACDIRGTLCAGVPVGVDISRLSACATNELLQSSLPLFLDSGAFSEVSFRGGQPSIKRRIGDEQWVCRLDKYLFIARSVARKRKTRNACAAVTVVAPDSVGNQSETLIRLAKFRSKIRQVHAAGADVVVALQTGSHDVVEFYKKAKAVLAIDIVPGMPMNKAATTPGAIHRLIQSVSPRRIHLLGLGANNHRARSLVRFIRQLSPDILISMDANRIRASVGQGRPITRNEKKHFDDLIPNWTGGMDLREWGGNVSDLTEMLFRPSHWLSAPELHQFAQSLTWLPENQRREFLFAPDDFVNADDNLNDWLFQSLREAYFRYVSRAAKRSARTRAVMEVLRESKISHQL
jgi:hypothetical protein